MSKEQRYERLGIHHWRDYAREIREGARIGAPGSREKLAHLDRSATAESLREKALDIVQRHIENAGHILGDDVGRIPQSEGSTTQEFGRVLLEWIKQVQDELTPDSSEGFAFEQLRICAHILQHIHTRSQPFLLGVVLGYGLSQKNHLQHREFVDGPNLRREIEQQKARSSGGQAKKAVTFERDKRIVAAYRAAKEKNRHQTPNGWAEKNCKKFGLSSERTRKILRANFVSN